MAKHVTEEEYLKIWESKTRDDLLLMIGERNTRITELEAQLTELRAEYQKLTVAWCGAVQLQDEYKAQLQQRADLAADIPVIAHNAELPQFDPVYVRTLQQAYSEMVTHTASIEDENKRLTELLRGDRMVVATRINHEYTKAKGTIRELQTENERLRALLENTRQQRDDAYQERAEAQRWQQLVTDEVHERIGKTIRIENEGRWIELEANDEHIGVWLDDLGCAIFRKVQP